jgi:hypothetical protein
MHTESITQMEAAEDGAGRSGGHTQVAEEAVEAAEAVAVFTEAPTRNTATNLTSIVLY